MTVLEVILKARVFSIKNCNRNIAIPLKIRGLATFYDLPFSRYVSLGGSYKQKKCKISFLSLGGFYFRDRMELFVLNVLDSCPEHLLTMPFFCF